MYKSEEIANLIFQICLFKINAVQTMNTSKPVPFTSDKSSSEDHSGNQMTGETTSGSSGQNTDTSTTDREKGQSGNTGKLLTF